MIKVKLLGTLLTLALASMVCPALTPAPSHVALAETDGLGIMQGNETYFRIDNAVWGPKWSWTSFRGNITALENRSVSQLTTTLKQTGAKLDLRVETAKTSPRQITVRYSLKSSKDTGLTLVIASLIPGNAFRTNAKVIAKDIEGNVEQRKIPLGIDSLGEAVTDLELLDDDGLKMTIKLSPAAEITADGSLRIILAKDQLKQADPKDLTLRIRLPHAFTFYASPDTVPTEAGSDQWFAWQPTQDYDVPSEIDMTDWLEAPAGKHGRIKRQDDKLIYHGQPIKLWGINLCYSTCAPDHSLADKRAQMYAKYGINSVRLHKYADGPGWQGIQGDESFLDFDSQALERMDYQIAQFKKRGIYTKLSSTFGVKLGPKDAQNIPYSREFGSLTGNKNRLSTGHGSVFLSRELQDLQIQQVVNLLNHKNPHTSLRYADDPAIAVVELFNEDSVLFFGTLRILQTIPTLRKRAAERFCTWLEARYGDEQGLVTAWGQGALNSFGNEGITGESLAKRTIVPAGNPWFFDPDQLAGSQKIKKQRLLDTMLFLYELQNEFYARYVIAIRNTGYQGEILASNWQAGRAYSHYYNLHSDSMVGLIDRHNYFGGRDGKNIRNASMCRVPGTAILSSGMQQVANQPFMLSEWIHVYPNEWGVEGPAIIGAYAMGLQGWDVSYMFQNRDDGGFSSRIGRDQWDATAPQVLGVFPAVARQVLREDVKESELLAPRFVHVPSLHNGTIGFQDKVTHEHDVKTFDSDVVPHRALAVARCVVEFTDEFKPTPAFDISRYFRDGFYEAATGQLRWKEGTSKHDGYFTIDTAATKAVVGFAQDEVIKLGDIVIEPKSRFAAIYVTAKEKNKDLRTSNKVLVVAVARTRNTGMKIMNDNRLLARGEPPVLMEPVRATLTLSRHGNPRVTVLDHDGRRTNQTVPVTGKKVTIDGAKHKTAYYLVEY